MEDIMDCMHVIARKRWDPSVRKRRHMNPLQISSRKRIRWIIRLKTAQRILQNDQRKVRRKVFAETDMDSVFLQSFFDVLERGSVDSYYEVPSLNGKRHGYGIIRFGYPFQDYVFATSWNRGVPTWFGYLYNRSTHFVFGRVHSFMRVEQLRPSFGILDEPNGRRWEGMCCGSQSCGFGECYDEDDNLVYRGMAIEGCWEGYGTTFHPICANGEHVDTQGMWSHGKLMGAFITFDRQGNKLCEGHQIDGFRIRFREEINAFTDLTIHCYLRELITASNSCNTMKTLNLDLLRYLQRLTIGSGSFRQCRSIILSQLSQLRFIHIGRSSFTCYGTNLELLLSESSSVRSQRRQLLLSNLKSLEEVVIEEGSFSDYSSVTLTDLPRLRSLIVGKPHSISCNFFYCDALELASKYTLRV